MSITEIATFVGSLPGVLTLRPTPGDGTPELAWGDLFFYYAPDGVLPPGQPFATVIVKDYPDEPPSGLGAGVFRVNVDAGRRGQEPPADPSVRDQVMPHPAYARLGWVCVAQPGPASSAELEALLREAHAAARRRWERRRE
ncbi:hypothetical protein IM660_19495 [Ruania alkalisoli]|uniref:DUF6194 domain-containing protein n=1 Tax=Ruania alkalisoli TaxID=2779775 RepID=A0A7M1SUV3_9MICO|nr:DUF6194 family protein [Ruania alkalisoli]QOR70724.1 hypothetical protein IM660_19495 [Ruania alkalisoli]